MSWVKLDDNILDHPKFIGLDNDALVLWLSCLTYCNRQKNDGALSFAVVEALAARRGLNGVDPHALVAAGLWESTETGFVIHDYLDYQPSRASLAADRVGAAERKRRSRARHGVTGHDVTGTGRDDDDEVIIGENQLSSSSSPVTDVSHRDNLVTRRLVQALKEAGIPAPRSVTPKLEAMLASGLSEQALRELIDRAAEYGAEKFAYVEQMVQELRAPASQSSAFAADKDRMAALREAS